MRGIFASPWLGRGLRFSVLVGLLAAGWHAWTVLDRYQHAVDRSFKSELTYRCAAGFSEEVLKPYMNGVGNINVKTLCLTGDDFFVAPYELEAVRAGTMKFDTMLKPFDWRGTAMVAVLWAVATILATIGTLAAVGTARWVWGRSASGS